MKIILKLLVVVVVGVVLAVLVAGGPMVKYLVNTFGSDVVGTDVSVTGADLDVLGGGIQLRGVTIANPPGYEQAHALTIGSVDVKLMPKSVLSDVVRINHILIDDVAVTFEGNLNGNNVQELQRQIANNTAADDHDHGGQMPMAADETEKDAKKVQIDTLAVTGTSVNFRVKELGDKPMTAELGDIRLNNIGTAEKGATATEVMDKVLEPLFENIHRAALRNIGGFDGRLKDLENKGGEVLNSVKDKFKDLF